MGARRAPRRPAAPPLLLVFNRIGPRNPGTVIAQLAEPTERHWKGTAYYGGFHMHDGKLPIVVTGMKQLKGHGPAGVVFRRFGRPQNQTLLEAIGNPRREARDARQQAEYAARQREHQEELRRIAVQHKAEREARRPVCAGCGTRFTDERWKAIEPAAWGTPRVIHPHMCDGCITAERQAEQARPEQREHDQVVPEQKTGDIWLSRFRASGDTGRAGPSGPAAAATPRASVARGLASIGEASVVMGAFREGAHRYASLPELVTAVEDSVCRNLEEVAETTHDAGEHFITAVVIDIHDQGTQAEMLNCGHPPPLLIRGEQVAVLNSRRPAPPLGLCALCARNDRTDPFTLETGDMLLLYTDGVIEARSPAGAFYPLAERVASFPASSPDTLLHRLHRDLLEHTGEELTDDAAFLIIERTPSRHLHRPHLTSHAGGSLPLTTD
ncbi:PP2C family protein-serine/threonine phosphatase [Streptomyces griseofuscus]|uniref:PP2C family protein-serine/threonine phosphatase n=1 Tax=Streptomyces griseofuscus TaxID=146922 RepID=UPI0037AE2CD4